mmetsp:Transcript_487/g.546  ORF Transcript_487/g.546 Transcript_487/m.546 type:complete len:237 (-) Transcript_487:44-754(-)
MAKDIPETLTSILSVSLQQPSHHQHSQQHFLQHFFQQHFLQRQVILGKNRAITLLDIPLHLLVTISSTINAPMMTIIGTIMNLEKIVIGLETTTTVIDMMKGSILVRNFVDEVVIGVIITTTITRTMISVMMIIIIVTTIMMKKIATGSKAISVVTVFRMGSTLVETFVLKVVTTVVKMIGAVVVTSKSAIVVTMSIGVLVVIHMVVITITGVNHQIVMMIGQHLLRRNRHLLQLQ